MITIRISMLSLGLAAAITASAADYTIAKKPKVGDSFKVKMKADLKIDSAPVVLTGTVVEKVTQVEADGTYTLEESQVDGVIKFRDTEMKAPQTPPSITKYKPTGEVIDFVNEQGKHDLRVANLTVFKLPGKVIKTGESWTYEQKGDKAKETVSFRALYTIGAEETIGKHKCLKIKQTITETEGAEPASVESTVWYDMDDWTEVKVLTKWNNVPMAGGSPVTGNITIERVDG